MQRKKYIVINGYVCDLVQEGAINFTEAYVIGLIDTFNRQGSDFFGSNQFLADECNLSEQRIRKMITKLVKKGILERWILSNKGQRKRVLSVAKSVKYQAN